MILFHDYLVIDHKLSKRSTNMILLTDSNATRVNPKFIAAYGACDNLIPSHNTQPYKLHIRFQATEEPIILSYKTKEERDGDQDRLDIAIPN